MGCHGCTGGPDAVMDKVLSPSANGFHLGVDWVALIVKGSVLEKGSF